MNISQIQDNIQSLIKNFSKESFIYDLLLAYNLPKASITRLQKGNLNLSKNEGEISWKKKLFYRVEYEADLHSTIDELKDKLNHNERFLIVTDYNTLLAIDMKTDDNLDIALKDLPKHYDFFLPWAGMEKTQHHDENVADVRAAEKMAKLFDRIKADNPDNSPEFIHGLNVFLSRLLFCFFAEDTNIFKKNLFTNSIGSHTQNDGTDLNKYLDDLFDVLNTSEKDRKDLPSYLSVFPYVNGGLFKQKIKSPKFTRRSRQAVIDSGNMNWSDINPDIFGSMFQAVITPEMRGGLGMHYTSVPNIMKVIKPLFLDDLYEYFEANKNKPKQLNELLHRLSKIKIFDPACGSGNFLIIAYKELRKLEIKIIKQLKELKDSVSGFEPFQKELIPSSQQNLAASFQVELFSRIQLNQFFGIEIDDFAHEVATLALWLAEHQMNVEFYKEFGCTNPTLPLKDAGHIVHANACRIDWEDVCPKNKDDEIYILGNPPYAGQKNQTDFHRRDLDFVFLGLKNYKKLDYISCWFYKTSNYIEYSMKAAFVTTNSICQGTQVELLWPKLFRNDVEINFAYDHFKWSNNARKVAGVTVTIIGLRKKCLDPKYIFKSDRKIIATNINSYLVDSKEIIIRKRLKSLSLLPKMICGNQPREGGYLILSDIEKENLIKENNESEYFLRRFIGANELINGIERWCIWINEKEVNLAYSIPVIADRIKKVENHRKNGNTVEKSFYKVPYRFVTIKQPRKSQIVLPIVTSETRKYIPIAYMGNNTIISSKTYVIFDAELYLFGILQSLLHMVWVKSVSARLGNGISYSAEMVYNTFPFPPISEQRKEEITRCVFRILEEREKHPEKTLAQLYDPDKMPDGLREAHRLNDLAIERCYRSKPFESDEERLEYLFKLYEKMIEEEKEKNTLFETDKKKNKKRK